MDRLKECLHFLPSSEKRGKREEARLSTRGKIVFPATPGIVASQYEDESAQPASMETSSGPLSLAWERRTTAAAEASANAH